VRLELIVNYSSHNRFIVGQKFVCVCGRVFLFAENFSQSNYVDVVDLRRWYVDKCNRVLSLKSVLFDQFELHYYQVFFDVLEIKCIFFYQDVFVNAVFIADKTTLKNFIFFVCVSQEFVKRSFVCYWDKLRNSAL